MFLPELMYRIDAKPVPKFKDILNSGNCLTKTKPIFRYLYE